MEIRLQTNTCHSYWIFNSSFCIHSVLLRNHMNNGLSGRNMNLEHIVFQRLQIGSANLSLQILTRINTRLLNTLNVLASNSHIHAMNFNAAFYLCFLHCFFNRCNCLINVQYNAALHTVTLTATNTQDGHLTE